MAVGIFMKIHANNDDSNLSLNPAIQLKIVARERRWSCLGIRGSLGEDRSISRGEGVKIERFRKWPGK